METASETLGLWVRAAPKIRFLITAQSPVDLEWETRMSLEPMPDEEVALLLAARGRAGLRGIDRSAPAAEALRGLAAMCSGSPLATELVAAEVLARGVAREPSRLLQTP